MATTKKKTHVCTLNCPHCAGLLDIFKETEVVTPAVKAEKKEAFFAVKPAQTTLN